MNLCLLHGLVSVFTRKCMNYSVVVKKCENLGKCMNCGSHAYNQGKKLFIHKLFEPAKMKIVFDWLGFCVLAGWGGWYKRKVKNWVFTHKTTNRYIEKPRNLWLQLSAFLTSSSTNFHLLGNLEILRVLPISERNLIQHCQKHKVVTAYTFITENKKRHSFS